MKFRLGVCVCVCMCVWDGAREGSHTHRQHTEPPNQPFSHTQTHSSENTPLTHPLTHTHAHTHKHTHLKPPPLTHPLTHTHAHTHKHTPGAADTLDEDCHYFTPASEASGPLPLSSPTDVRNTHTLLSLFSRRSFALLERLALKLQGLVEGEGKSQMTAWKMCLVDVIFVSRAHSMYTILRHFAEGIATLRAGNDPSGVKDVRVGVCLEKLLWLFALYHLSRETGDFLELGLLLPEEAQVVRDEVYALLTEVRVDAVGLCDSWDWSDFELKSTLGRYDGQVYEALLKSAKQEPLNLSDPVEGFDRHWRPYYRVQEQQQQAKL